MARKERGRCTEDRNGATEWLCASHWTGRPGDQDEVLTSKQDALLGDGRFAGAWGLRRKGLMGLGVVRAAHGITVSPRAADGLGKGRRSTDGCQRFR